jgi:S-DNA-T family DNA segregation ATPase FtsK/SpoIIIE
MSACKFPEHHTSAAGGGSILALVALAAAAAASVYVVVSIVLAAVAFTAAHLLWFILPPALAAGAWLARHLLYIARAGRSAWSYLPGMMWAAFRWRWLTRNTGTLAYIDRHHRRKLRPRLPFTTGARVQAEPTHKLRWPTARWRLDRYGWAATVRTIPKVGRAELDKAAPWLADAWRCHRVQITQPKPGRVVIRGLRRDLLAEPYPLADAPAGLFDHHAGPPLRLYLGRDLWGVHRWQPLANLPAVLVAGMTGYGKTTLLTGWLAQLLASPTARLAALFDLKGSADFEPWAPLARIVTGDDLTAVADGLADVHALMRDRLASIGPDLGVRNIWRVGLSQDWPLQITVMDEAATALDLDAHKGDREAERRVREIRHHTTELARKGRSVGMFTVIASQVVTGDVCPTLLRDNIPLSLSFAAKTRDKAVAALGSAITDYPTMCPTTLLDERYRGCMTATLRTGLDPFTMLRCPDVTEQAAADFAAQLVPPRRRLVVVPEPESQSA